MKNKTPTLLQRCLFRTPKPIRLGRDSRPGRNQACPCESGKKFKHCCKTTSLLVDRMKERIAAGEMPDPDAKR